MNTGNGSDQVDISDGTTQVTPANLTVGSFTVTPNTDVILGGTVSDAAATYDGGADETTITVGNLIPADFANGDTVRIGGVFTGTEYTVVSSSATQLVLSGDATGEITGAGIQIGEVISVSYDGTAGTLQNSSPTEIHRHELTATTDLPTGGTATSGTWDTTVNGGSISVTKYVRNIDTPNGTAPAVSINVGGTTSDYFITGVTGDPGEILEYVVVIENTGAGNASNVVMTDTLSGFLNLTNTSIRVDIDDDNTFDADTSSSDADTATPPETVSAGDGIVVVTGSTLTVYAGSAGTDVAPAAGGTLPSSTTSEVSYRATIQ
jgi:uncharacterized repeat protein (TIGR01451 family)